MRIQSIGDYYTLQGAAEALKVSYWKVWRAVRQQHVPTRLLGKTLLVRLWDVEVALLHQRLYTLKNDPETGELLMVRSQVDWAAISQRERQ